VDAAKYAGADAVKFQTFKAEKLVTLAAEKAVYQTENTGHAGSQMDMLKALELADEAFVELKKYCESQEIGFLSTPYGDQDVDLLEGVGVDAYKIASALSVEPEFVKYCCSKGKPVILATGMASLEELRCTMEMLTDEERSRVILLQCTTNYPACSASANLKAIQTLKNEFGCLSGYSDHTVDELTAVMSIAMGACMLERHLTLDKGMEGPDHKASSDPAELKGYIEQVRLAESALGTGEKEPCEEERQNMERMRRSVVMARSLSKGQTISREDLTVKRPATGILPREIHEVVGCRAVIDLNTDETLTWDKLDR
ncbi:MAG: N-acetylneuraminate synthase family protein, partial [Verrucomicrobiota bacterium]